MSSAQDEGAETPARTAAVPAEATRDSIVGRQVAERYALAGLIGSGSIGRSYLAHDPDGGKVVVKVVQASLANDEAFVRRFGRELDGAIQLEHPHVARTLAHGVDPSLGSYAVREFVDGDDLITALGAGARTPRRICELFMQLLGALSEAHRHGVLHQNLKPSNVRVVRDANGRETVKVCDFGNPQRARPGAEYLAPEQATAQQVDGQADVYAVGVLLFEALTDDVPFRADTPRETLDMHRTEVIPTPHERRPDRPLPRELEAVCLKALAKQPRERHRSPREMSQALRAVVSLLGQRADEPLGSTAFADPAQAVQATTERLTMPGEQLRSRHKFWLGAALLILVCVAVLFTDTDQPMSEPTRSESSKASATENGERALQSGTTRLAGGDNEGALTELRNARRALGDRPDVLRSLGEALLVEGSTEAREEGVGMLKRYLELEPTADDREFVQRLLRHAGEQP
jgi:serine/threonine protein kinase